jgi:hypothetical protein
VSACCWTAWEHFSAISSWQQNIDSYILMRTLWLCICFVLDEHVELDFIVQAHRNNSQEIHSPKQQSRDTLRPTCIYYHDPEQTSSEFILSYRRSNKHNNFIVFGLTRPGFEPTIYRNRGDHANYYTTEAITLTITQPRRSR